MGALPRDDTASPATAGAAPMANSGEPTRIDLCFDVPIPTLWRGPGLLARRAARGIFAADQPNLVEPLRQASVELETQNRSRMMPARRLRDADALAQALCPNFLRHYEQLGKDQHGVPESKAQRERLDALDGVLTRLITAYQLAFQAEYEVAGPGISDSAANARLVLAATRVLEWIHHAQRLRALRYKPLAPAHWRVANTVFFAMARAFLAELDASLVVGDPLHGSADGRATPARLYLAIQSFALFDGFAWPRRHQAIIDHYCARVPDGVRILLGQGAAPGADARYTHAYHDGPPAAARPDPCQPWASIDFSRLAAAVREDQYRHPVSPLAASAATAPALARLPSMQRRPILRQMARDMDDARAPGESAASADIGRELHLVTGLTEVREHLRQVFSRGRPARDSMQLSALSSDCSAPVSAPVINPPREPWRIVDHGAHRLRISIQEEQVRHAVGIGAIAAYGQSGGEFEQQPRLGKVARVLRTDAGALLVDLHSIARFAALVRVRKAPRSDDNAAEGGERLPSLLVYDADFGWGLVTPRQDRLGEGQSIEICTKRHQLASRLRSLRDATPQFLLFQIDSYDAQLGVPAYPRARQRRRQEAARQTRPRGGEGHYPVARHHAG